jgi:hypothetical protein
LTTTRSASKRFAGELVEGGGKLRGAVKTDKARLRRDVVREGGWREEGAVDRQQSGTGRERRREKESWKWKRKLVAERIEGRPR